MKMPLLICGVIAMLGLPARGGIWYSPTYSVNTDVPDGNPVGLANQQTISGLPSVTADVTVTINVSGGYNGDLYAYLSHGGVLVPLLNRVGVTSGDSFGYGDSGFYNLTFSSTATGTHDVHFYDGYSPSFNGSGQLTGTSQPDGRVTDPLSASRVDFGSFNTVSPNGTWTLFFADLSAGGVSTLQSWSMSISTVPEPVNVALGIAGAIFAVVGLARSRRLRQLIRRIPA